LTVDDAALTAANVIESDLITVAGGFKLNLSGQRHVATGEIGDGNWTDTGLMLGPLTALAPHSIIWTYSFNTVTNVCSVVSYTCDGVVFPMAAKFQNVVAEACDWTTGAYIQIRLGSLPAASRWENEVSDITIDDWS
jgi:hypothetical protein